MENDVKFIDADAWQGSGKNDAITFRDIVMRQVAKISQNANCELRGGYWEERPVMVGQMGTTAKVYVPDTREVFNNSVEFLFDLIFPYSDGELKRAGQRADQEIEEAHLKYTVEETRTDTNYSEGKKADRKFSDVGDRVMYRTAKVKIMKALFREISCFLKRVDYFDGKSYSEEV